jgi:predicted outer membrane repeat protein
MAVSALAQASTWYVTTASDSDYPAVPGNCVANSSASGACSLRDAVTAAASGDAIQFTVTGTITLSAPLNIPVNMAVTGPGGAGLTLTAASGLNSLIEVGQNVTFALSNVTFANSNLSGSNGGSVLDINGASVQLDAVTFFNNIAGNNANGAAIHNGGGSLTINHSTFTSNYASTYGGAIYTTGSLSVNNSTFSGNSSANSGGAIFGDTGSAVAVYNSTFYGNVAVYSGAAIGSNSSLTAINDTIVGNTATDPAQSNGAGIGYSGTLVIKNTILSGNAASQSADCYSQSGSCPVNGSNGNVVSIPALNLAPLGNYGGTTQTLLPLSTSSAVCAGVYANLPTGVSSDQRGWPVNQACVDAGAVQTNYWVINTLVDSLNSTDTSSCSDGQGNSCSLRDALAQAQSASQADIEFAPALFLSGAPAVATPGAIHLGNGLNTALPQITGALNLVGPGANLLTVSGDSSAVVGSIFNVGSNSAASLFGMTIANGYETGGNGSGGGLLTDGTVTVAGCVFSANDAASFGGGVFNDGALTVTGSTFSANYSMEAGGAIANAGTLALTNSTLIGNSTGIPALVSGFGGGISNSASMTVTNSTFTGNTAGAFGGGINTAGATIGLANSIVAGNSNASSPDDCDGCGSQSAPNLIGLPSGITNVNQILGALSLSPANAGVQTMLPLPGASSILCAGLAKYLPSGVTTDERGFPMDPNCAAGSIDLGAAQTNYTGVSFLQQPPGQLAENVTISPAVLVQVQETDALTGAVDGVSGVPVAMTMTNTSTSADATANLGGTLTEGTAPVTYNGASVNAATYGDLSVTALGTFDLTATASSTLTGTSSQFTVYNLALTSQLAFTAAPPIALSVGSSPGALTVSEENQGGALVSSTGDSITLTVTGPSQYRMQYQATTQSGVATFNLSAVMLTAAGSYTYTATFGSITATAPLETVSALATAAGLAVSGFPKTAYVGIAAGATIEAVDTFGNVVTGYNGTASVTTSDSAAVIAGSPVTLTNGAGTVTITFNTPTSGGKLQSITASSAMLTGASETGITVNTTIPSFVVTQAGDADNGGDAGTVCTDQNISGNTPGAGCTLRDAITAANNAGAGNITFSSTVFSGATTITITPTDANGNFGFLPVGANISLTGLTSGSGSSSTNLITLSGAGATPIMAVEAGAAANVTLANLNFTNGFGNNADPFGALGIYDSVVSVTNCSFTGNQGIAAGAIMQVASDLTVTASTFSGNTSTTFQSGPFYGDGAAIYNLSAPSLVATLASFTAPIRKFSFIRGKSPAAALKLNKPLPMQSGGATSGTLTVTNSTFSQNAGQGAGGIYNFGNLVVTGSTFTGNTSQGDQYNDAAAIFTDVFLGSSSITGFPTASVSHGKSHLAPMAESSASTPRRRAANKGPRPDYFGPAPGSGMSNATIVNTNFSNNSGGMSGGVFNLGEMTITGGSFTSNTGAYGAGAVIGAFYTDPYYPVNDPNTNDGYLSIFGATFANNSGPTGGAAVNMEGSFLYVQGATFNANICTDTTPGDGYDAGAIASFNEGETELAIDTFFGNSSPVSGAGALSNSAVGETGVFGTTISGNSGFLGALYYSGSGCIDTNNGENCTYLFNSIVSGNSTTDPNAAADNTTPDVNGWQVGSGTGDVIGSNAISLAPLGNYGGTSPTQTMLPLPGSTAICAGQTSMVGQNDFYTGVTITTDQRGFPNTNPNYPGYSAGSPCMDAGSVQTSYAMAFSAQPPASVAANVDFTAAVSLTESGLTLFPPVSIPLTLNGNGALNGGAASTSNGVATYTALQVTEPGTGDTLTANLVLNPTQPPLVLSATSNSFNVAGGDFSIVVTGPSSATMIPGGKVSYQVIVSPLFGSYTAPVTFTIGVLPQGTVAAFNPATIPANGGTQTVTIPIQMVLGTASQLRQQPRRPGSGYSAPWVLALLLLPMAAARRLRRSGRSLRNLTLLLFLATAGLLAGLTGCNTITKSSGYQTGTFNLTITATSGGFTHSVPVTLTVE